MSSTDGQKYNYFCLRSRPDLCLGVSPGSGVPAAGNLLQLKPRYRNQQKKTDWKKMRWDFIDEGHALRMTNFNGLCMGRAPPPNAYGLALNDCTDPDVAAASQWTFDEDAGLLRFGDTGLCASATVCVSRDDNAQSCSSRVKDIVTDASQLSEGSVMRLKACYDTSSQDARSVAQVFQRDADCSLDCAPDMQGTNGQCDPVCDTAACHMDDGECGPGGVFVPPGPDRPTWSPSVFPVDGDNNNNNNNNNNNKDGGGDLTGPTSASSAPFPWWALLIVLIILILGGLLWKQRRDRRRRYALTREDMLSPEDGEETRRNGVLGEAVASVDQQKYQGVGQPQWTGDNASSSSGGRATGRTGPKFAEIAMV